MSNYFTDSYLPITDFNKEAAINYGTDNFTEYCLTNFFKNSKLPNIHSRVFIYTFTEDKNFTKASESLDGVKFITSKRYDGKSYSVMFNDSVIAAAECKTKLLTLTCFGDLAEIARIEAHFNDKLERIDSILKWIYSADGSSMELPLKPTKLPIDEMYPFMDKPLSEYYQEYIDSSASVLLLIGPPGTGKTTWIQGFLEYYNKDCVLTFDPEILKRDYIFADFIEEDYGAMVIEDADNFLSSRKEGNTIMHKFLNVADGIVSSKNKKLIFSTNLPDVSSVDKALTRVGRCFDILKFDTISVDEAKILCKKLDIDFKNLPEQERYTVGEIYNKKTGHKHVKGLTERNRIGFT